ncbi:unnamed protein product [Dicrocoelium dendriticum]|nr:unnamed protein product [Dicrocoelium dendriticum]
MLLQWTSCRLYRNPNDIRDILRPRLAVGQNPAHCFSDTAQQVDTTLTQGSADTWVSFSSEGTFPLVGAPRFTSFVVAVRFTHDSAVSASELFTFCCCRLLKVFLSSSWWS